MKKTTKDRIIITNSDKVGIGTTAREQPAEDEILDFVRFMVMKFEGLMERESEEIKQGASYYLKAYRTVEEFILRMKELR